MKLSRTIVAAVGAFILLAGFGCARDTTVILVRHAERGPGQDPVLTPAGVQRAEDLVDVGRHAGVSSIYVTPFRRTQLTAGPTAQALGLTPIIMPIDGTPEAHAAAIASDIRSNRAGTCVLVVGHSNTVPLIIAALGSDAEVSIDESEFDRVFVLIRRKDAPTRLIEARYGE